MFEMAYQRTMKHASRILFALAVLLFIAGLAGGFTLYAAGRSEWLMVLNPIFTGLNNGIFPLIGAVVIDRFDRSRIAVAARENSN